MGNIASTPYSSVLFKKLNCLKIYILNTWSCNFISQMPFLKCFLIGQKHSFLPFLFCPEIKNCWSFFLSCIALFYPDICIPVEDKVSQILHHHRHHHTGRTVIGNPNKGCLWSNGAKRVISSPTPDLITLSPAVWLPSVPRGPAHRGAVRSRPP